MYDHVFVFNIKQTIISKKKSYNKKYFLQPNRAQDP